MRNTIVVALMLAAAACADKPEVSEGPPPDTAGGKPDLSHPEVGVTVAVVVNDTSVELSSDSVTAVGTGQMSFSVRNAGTVTKDVTIDGGALGRWQSIPIAPGQAVLMSQLMSRGSYRVVWPGKDKEVSDTITVH